MARADSRKSNKARLSRTKGARRDRSLGFDRLQHVFERLEDRRMLTATLTQVGTTLKFTYTGAAVAPSITGIDGALTFSTGGGEAVALGGGVAGAPIVNGAIVTNSASFTTIEISGPSGGTETFSTLAAGLNVAEAFQLDSTVHQATFAGTVTTSSIADSTPTDLNGGTVTTIGGQTYNNAVVLSTNTILVSTGAAAVANITFGSTVDNATATARSLTVTADGIADFKGFVGSGANAGLLSVTTGGNTTAATGTTQVDAGSASNTVTTTTFQSYQNSVTLGANTVLASTASGNITFSSTIDSDAQATPRNLTVNTQGTTWFKGNVGLGGAADNFSNTTANKPLASLTTDAGGTTQLGSGAAGATIGILTWQFAASAGTTGIANFTDDVVLEANTTVDGNSVTFGGNVDRDAVAARNLTVFANVGTPVTHAIAAASTTINPAKVTIVGSVGGGGNGAIGALAINARGTLVSLDGSNNLVVADVATGGEADSLTLSFDGTNYVLSDPNNQLFTQLAGFNLSADGHTLKIPAIDIGGTKILLNLDGGTDVVNVNLTGANPFTKTVTYNGGAGTDIAHVNLDVTAALPAGGITIVGGGGPTSLDVSGSGQTAVYTPSGATAGSGTITIGATDSIAFSGLTPIDIHGMASATLQTAAGDQGVNVADSNTSFTNGAQHVLLVTPVAGAGVAFEKVAFWNNTNLTIDTSNNPGVIADPTRGSVTVASAQGSDGLGNHANTNLTITTKTGNAVTNSVTFTGAAALHGSLAVTADKISLGGATVKTGTTAGASGQTYTGAVTLAATETLSDGNGGKIWFKGATTTVDATTAGVEGLTTSTTGTTEFDAAVGNSVALGALDVKGAALLSGAIIKTRTGGQTYEGAVTLGATETLSDTNAGKIWFKGATATVDATTAGVEGLTTNTTGTTEFDAAVGNSVVLGALDIKGSALLSGAIIKTRTGGQTYEGAVTLGATETLSDTNAGKIWFKGATATVDATTAGVEGLTTNTTGTTEFDAAVGNSVALGALDVKGPAALNGGTVKTKAGGQNYEGAVTLGATTGLTDTGAGGNITFGSTVNGHFDLTVMAGVAATLGGNVNFNGLVGNLAPLGTIAVTTLGNSATIAVNAQTKVASPSTVTLTSSGTQSQIDVNAPIVATSVKLAGGATGHDFFNVEAVDAGSPLRVDALNGNNNIYVSSTIVPNTTSRTATTATGNLQSILGPLTVNTSGAGNGLVVSDIGGAAADNARISATGSIVNQITGFAPAVIAFTYTAGTVQTDGMAPAAPKLRLELDGANPPTGCFTNKFLFSVPAAGLNLSAGLDVAVDGGGAHSMSVFIIDAAAEGTNQTTAIVMSAGASQNNAPTLPPMRTRAVTPDPVMGPPESAFTNYAPGQYAPSVVFEARDLALIELFGGSTTSTGDWLENRTVLTGPTITGAVNAKTITGTAIPTLVAGGLGHDILIGGLSRDVIFGGGGIGDNHKITKQQIFTNYLVADYWLGGPTQGTFVHNINDADVKNAVFATDTDFLLYDSRYTYMQQQAHQLPTINATVGPIKQILYSNKSASTIAGVNNVDKGTANSTGPNSFGAASRLTITEYLLGKFTKGTKISVTNAILSSFNYLNGLLCSSIFPNH